MAKDLWFPKEEICSRLTRLQAYMKDAGMELLLAFEPESVTYFTGYFTNAYTTFQFAIIPAEGEPVVVIRDVEEYYFRLRCVFESFVGWRDADNPIDVMVKTVTSMARNAGRIGIEKGSWQLNAARYEAICNALPSSVFVDVTTVLKEIRYIKSPFEIEYQRKAAQAAERAMAAAVNAAKAGCSERDVAVAAATAMIMAGSDHPGPGVLSSGERAKHLHGSYTDRILETGDTVQYEATPSVRNYHARFMRTIKVGRASQEDIDLISRIISIQDRALQEVGPGVAAAVPDKIIRDAIRSSNLATNYTNRTFYSVGLLLRPNGMESLVAAPGCTWKFQPGMTFHTYLLLQGFGFSETILITDTGYERLTKFRRELLISEQ